jgi:hypothetical protein
MWWRIFQRVRLVEVGPDRVQVEGASGCIPGPTS